MVEAAVVGLGGWGKNHARVLNEIGALRAVCDLDGTKVSHYSAMYKVKGYTSLDEMLDKEKSLEAAVICTPTRTHFDVASRAIKKMLDIFVEKPLAPSSNEAEALHKLSEKEGVKLAVGYIERFNPAVRDLKALLTGGEVGLPLLLEFHRENRIPLHIKDTGVVEDTTVHDIDTARWLFGEEPNSVYARTGRVMGDKEDFAAIILSFSRQNTAFITSNWVTPKRVRELTAVCTKGVATIDFISQELRVDSEEGTKIPRRAWQEPLLLELKDFMECVGTSREPLVTGLDGIRNTRIAEAVLESSRTGLPIKINYW